MRSLSPPFLFLSSFSSSFTSDQVVITDEDKLSSDSRPTDSGQVLPAASSPKLEAEDPSFSDLPDEIHEDPRSPSHLSEEVVKAAVSPISTPPETDPEKVQEDDISSLPTEIPDICDEDPVATVPDVTLPSPGPGLSTLPTPKRSTSRTPSRSRSRSPSLLSSPLTCLSSSPIREDERRQSASESDFTDVETTSKPVKTSVKRRSDRKSVV